jgi:hypothetical protein
VWIFPDFFDHFPENKFFLQAGLSIRTYIYVIMLIYPDPDMVEKLTLRHIRKADFSF